MISFFVSGVPAPQGSKRHVGNGRMIESSKKVKPWREAVARVASAHVLDEPVDGHLRVIIRFELPPPKKSRFGNRPAGPPDLDKLVRSTLDGLTASGLIVDDARVVSLTATKHWALDTPGASVSVERLSEGTGADLSD